jgi:hypothetical protein
MNRTDHQFWRVHCHIGHHPGQWQYWFREQCCAVGWHPTKWRDLEQEGWSLHGGAENQQDWIVARNALLQMKAGDWVVATLPHWRVGRLGQIVTMEIEDGEWNPIIPPSKSMPFGENGRRILVRWDLTLGPEEPSKVVLLPANVRWNSGQVRGTIRSLPFEMLTAIRSVMRDEANWVSLAGAFSLEAALSDYISIHPGRLEAGMIAHPSINVRELSFRDRSRADVILQDRSGRLVVAECKQNAPSVSDLEQVDHYRRKLEEEYPDLGRPRAILVHGGASRVMPETANAAASMDIGLVYFELQVNFFGARG